MNALKMAAVVLIVAGVLGLVYGSFSYTKETHEAKLGPIELSVKDKEGSNAIPGRRAKHPQTIDAYETRRRRSIERISERRSLFTPSPDLLTRLLRTADKQ